ncbi:NAD-binding protein [Frankia sp. Ag45/Mut15]|uniref:NAD-binding protein n=1 Tax=Frankia umida TaxID=573489 RepID=A0ABT0JV27_9ACTN|nr:NAD(P)-dependent oxidoreductase [Frankia umida]MCK9875399.1 NAD-binding protein [Frankia umida]
MHTHPLQATVGFPRESGTDRRTILTPLLARALLGAGIDVIAEPGIGAGIFLEDKEYATAGVRFAAGEQVWAAPLVARYTCTDPADLSRLARGQHIAALFHAEGDIDLLDALRRCGATAWSYEFVAEDGRFPLGRPSGRIAGVQAVLAGAHTLQAPAGRGVLLAPVDGAPRASVLVIGSGNVGAAAAQTAAALGAQVTVLTRTQRSAADYQRQAPQGVRIQVNTRQNLLAGLAEADLVIGTILVSTYDTPPMIDHGDLEFMRPGAVIVDATCGYGPGYLPTAGPVQAPGDPPRVVAGILHVKIAVFPTLVPVTASAAYAANAAPYLVRLAQAALAGAADPAIEAARIASDGELVHPVLRAHARIYGMRP